MKKGLGLLVLLIPVYLAALYGLTQMLSHFFFEISQVEMRTVSVPQAIFFGLGIIALFTPALYLVSRLLAKKHLVFHPDVILFMGLVTLSAIFMELVVDSLWVTTFGRPVWTYHILPTHGGFTSKIELLAWPVYGFYLYALHEDIANNPRLHLFNNLPAKSILIGMDAMMIEVLLNAYALLAVGSYFFYYHAPDLSHFTATEIFPVYVLVGGGGLWLLKRLDKFPHPVRIGLICYVLAAVLVFI